MSKLLMGIDGGGTHVRVVIADLAGNLRSYIKQKGGTVIFKDANAIENVQSAMRESFLRAGCKPGDLAGLTIGTAGFDGPGDLDWIRKLTDVSGLGCVPQHVSDAVTAQYGAFAGEAGVVAIAGTGSVTFGINEDGKHLRNYDFHHYANAAARHLAYRCVQKVIAGEADESDKDLINAILAHFEVADLVALTELGAEGFIVDQKARNKHFGLLAPAVTDAALHGSGIASAVCKQAADEIATSIRLVGACFASDTVNTALIGGSATSLFMKAAVQKLLNEPSNKTYRLVSPALPPELGAVMMTMKNCQIEITDSIYKNLQNAALTIEGHAVGVTV